MAESPVAAAPAATVLVLRDGDQGPELFMMRRVDSMPFAPGMYVFPGGRLDREDHQPMPKVDSPALIDALGRSTVTPAQLWALLHCAEREVREEAGVAITVDDLTLVGRWVTPEFESRRYDVHFFAAHLPEGQVPYSASSETDLAGWFTPDHCLQAFANGSMPMLPPTLAMLASCAGHRSSTALLQSLGSTQVRPYLPRPLGGDREIWCIVDAETNEVLVPRIRRPHARESNAGPLPAGLT